MGEKLAQAGPANIKSRLTTASNKMQMRVSVLFDIILKFERIYFGLGK